MVIVLLEIGGEIIVLGEIKKIVLDMFLLYIVISMNILVFVKCGKCVGFIMFVSVVIYGDELNGIEIVLCFICFKSIVNLKGILIVVLMVNVYGVLNQFCYLLD